MKPDRWIPDPGARLRVWTVRAEPADHDQRTDPLPNPGPFRVPAYTPAEAVQVAARHSGLHPDTWARYLWTLTPQETTP